MAEFGKFTELTFVNDATPPISASNLNEIERILEDTDNELSRSKDFKFDFYKEYFWQRNCKKIEDFQVVTGWTACAADGASTIVSADTTNFLIGIQSMKFLVDTPFVSWVGMYKTVTALDLSKFNDGYLADDTQHIMVNFYISDKTKFTAIQFKLGTDNSNNYAFLYSAASLRNGWNCINASKDSAIVAGAPSWANITYIRCEATTPAGSINAYISVQYIGLYRKDPYSDLYFSPFQKYNGVTSGYEYDGPEINFDTWALYYDPSIYRLGIMMLDNRAAVGNEATLHVYCSIINFISKFELYCKSAGESPSFTWQVDGNNYIEGYISSNILYLDFIEGGVTTSNNIALTNGLLLNERVQIIFEKEGQTARIILLKDGENIKKLEYEISISLSTSGCLFIGSQGALDNGFITDYIVGHKNILCDSWDTPRVIMKAVDQVVNNSTAFINDDELFCNLPPNEIFLIEANIASSNISTDAADIKFGWALTGDAVQLKGKHLFTMPTNITSCVDGNLKATVFDLTTSNTVGHDGTSSETLTYERFLVKTGNIGGKIQLRFAQNSANASDTTVDNQSFMIVSKVKK